MRAGARAFGRASTAFSLHRPPGHHALPTRAMGFCLFNNIAVAARHALRAEGIERVLIFDWDAAIDRPTGPPAEHAHSPAEGWDRIARSGLRPIERIRDARFPYHFIVRAARRT